MLREAHDETVLTAPSNRITFTHMPHGTPMWQSKIAARNELFTPTFRIQIQKVVSRTFNFGSNKA